LTAAAAEWRRCARVAVVTDALSVAPWAEALIAQDLAWWENRPAAQRFPGRRFSTNPIPIAGVERIARHDHPRFGTLASPSTNSGALGIYVCVQLLGARRVLLYGFDLHGFTRHEPPLENPTPEQVEVFQRQYGRIAAWCRSLGVVVENRTRGSALAAFLHGY
jgi:hypothetical protein